MIESVSSKNKIEVDAFLKRFEDSSQFLINNLRAFGPVLTDHHNSGNFKVIRRNGEVKAVFCLTRRGNLIVQSEVSEPELILAECENEPVPVKGFIGDWNSVEPIYALFKESHPEFAPTYESKEILYRYSLKSSDAKIKFDSRVRLFESADFPQWSEFVKSYREELSLPDGLSDEARRKEFEAKVKDKTAWGLFDGTELISKAELNSRGEGIGQVGGVFTPKEFRQKGLAKAVMFHMLKDCMDLHGHKKSILFTGSGDNPAQKLYESMGYERHGFFALIV